MKYSIASVMEYEEPCSSLSDIKAELRKRLGNQIDEHMKYDLNLPLWNQLEIDLRRQFRFKKYEI